MSARVALSVLAAALAVAAAPAVARAGCGGGGGGGGGGHGGGSGGHASGGYGGSYVPSCLETSEVLGFRRCTHFGDWDVAHVPAFAVELGGSFHLVDGTDLVGMQNGMHESGANVGVGVDGVQSAPMGTFDLRARMFLTPTFYLGGELAVGGGPAAPGTRVSLLGPTEATGTASTTYFGGALLFGGRVPLGPIDLRAELALGGLYAATDVSERLYDCVNYLSFGTTMGLVEPRLAIDVWLTPWITASVVGGVNLIGPANDAQVGLALGFHTRPRDGAG